VGVGGERCSERERERASERKGDRATERQNERARERVYTILECRKLKDRSLYVQIYSDITCFHAKCRDPPQGRDPERGMVRDRKWEKERERES